MQTETTERRQLIAVCMPGSSFSIQWVVHFLNFLPQFVTSYDFFPVLTYSNNIYMSRNACVRHVEQYMDRMDYVLWIDSDNLVDFNNFMKLMEAIQAPGRDAVGGWYWIQSPDGSVRPCAGMVDTEGEEKCMEKAPSGSEPIKVDWMGFGFLLMKADVLRKMGPDPFRAGLFPNGRLMADDTGFCVDAAKKGISFFVHPGVHVPHLKLLVLGGPE